MMASKFKAAAHSDLSQSSHGQSLLKPICYPESYRFSTIATRWGYVHKSTTRDAYLISENGQIFSIHDRGLVIHPQYPHLGASPDGFVHCYCCTCGVFEIKCPFSCKDHSFLQAARDHMFCLETTEDGRFVLKENMAIFIKCSYRWRYVIFLSSCSYKWRYVVLTIVTLLLILESQ